MGIPTNFIRAMHQLIMVEWRLARVDEYLLKATEGTDDSQARAWRMHRASLHTIRKKIDKITQALLLYMSAPPSFEDAALGTPQGVPTDVIGDLEEVDRLIYSAEMWLSQASEERGVTHSQRQAWIGHQVSLAELRQEIEKLRRALSQDIGSSRTGH